MQPEYASPYRPLARPDAVVAGGTWRFTVLTDALIRVEYDEDGRFTDAPTQTVQCREFSLCRFTVRRDGEGLTLETDRLLLKANLAILDGLKQQGCNGRVSEMHEMLISYAVDK